VSSVQQDVLRVNLHLPECHWHHWQLIPLLKMLFFAAGWQHAVAAVNGQPHNAQQFQVTARVSDQAVLAAFALLQVAGTQWRLPMGSHTMRSILNTADCCDKVVL
jgi:hypothetical protein